MRRAGGFLEARRVIEGTPGLRNAGVLLQTDILTVAGPSQRAIIARMASAERGSRRAVLSRDTDGAAGELQSPEDILLQKLRWYTLGHDVSDRQWRDVLGIIAVQGDRLDLPYLRTAAAEVDILDVLNRALADAPPAA